VTWEQRRPKGTLPNWYRGAHLAKKVLDVTDPGRRFWKIENVQFDSARLANANWAAFACILAEPVTPLKLEDDPQLYGWLLEGTKAEVHKIHGSTGLSPSLLHIFPQITRLSAILEQVRPLTVRSYIARASRANLPQNPESIVLPVGGERLRTKLVNFRQHSELSHGYPTSAELFASCKTDDDGKVTTATEVTELTGETWVAAAQIYLECRFFRYAVGVGRLHTELDRS
jgi:hypothetical protein